MTRAILVDCFISFNDPASTEIYTLSLHDALPISANRLCRCRSACRAGERRVAGRVCRTPAALKVPGRHRCPRPPSQLRSEEHTSELQSRQYLVCRLLLEKKKKNERAYRIKKRRQK